MMITVFTPSYNREDLLPRLYDSLCVQTFSDFEWVIVDDGSTDNTQELVNKIISNHKKFNPNFPIRYYYKANGGKHTAINLGVNKACGDLFFIADSDDYLPSNALELVIEQWNEVKNDDSFGGVCGLDLLKGKKEIVGGIPPYEILDCTFLEYWWKFKMKNGDMKEVYRTSVLREFPFPEISGEKFCPEELVWARIAQKYKLRYFSEVIYIADYQEHGISANMTRMRMQSPLLSMMMYVENVSYDILPFSRKVRYAINYWRFRACFHGSSLNALIKLPVLRWYWVWTAPLGFVLHVRDSHMKK